MGDDFEMPDFTLEFAELNQFLDKADDRVVAIVAAAYCENWVQEVIESRMPGLDNETKGRLFKTGRPLGTADARYDLARALNIITPRTYRDLKRLATIRNRFAHFIAVTSFDHPKVAQQVDNLETDAEERTFGERFDATRRGRFVANALSLCIRVHNAVNDTRSKR